MGVSTLLEILDGYVVEEPPLQVLQLVSTLLEILGRGRVLIIGFRDWQLFQPFLRF